MTSRTRARRRLARLAALLVAGAGLLVSSGLNAQTFEAEQRAYERVEQAFQSRQAELETLFAAQGIAFPPREIFLRVIKRERVLEVWARADGDDPFAWLTTIPICQVSGVPGPKRREGDRQHPEGFYTIDRFNPRSSYHLSLRISYPNDSDDVLSDPDEPGSDIYIHGSCGSSGCLAIEDAGAERLYVLAVLARSAGQQDIPIHIFPARFDDEGEAWLHEVTVDRQLWAFWNNLREGYQFFETHRLPPEVSVDEAGAYRFSDPRD